MSDTELVYDFGGFNPDTGFSPEAHRYDLNSYDIQFDTENMIVKDRFAYLLSGYGEMYKINRNTGEYGVLWNLDFLFPEYRDSGLDVNTIVVDDALFVAGKEVNGRNIIAELDIETGTVVRARALPEFDVVLGHDAPRLVALNKLDMARDWMDKRPLSLPNKQAPPKGKLTTEGASSPAMIKTELD